MQYFEYNITAKVKRWEKLGVWSIGTFSLTLNDASGNILYEIDGASLAFNICAKLWFQSEIIYLQSMSIWSVSGEWRETNETRLCLGLGSKTFSEGKRLFIQLAMSTSGVLTLIHAKHYQLRRLTDIWAHMHTWSQGKRQNNDVVHRAIQKVYFASF